MKRLSLADAVVLVSEEGKAGRCLEILVRNRFERE